MMTSEVFHHSVCVLFNPVAFKMGKLTPKYMVHLNYLVTARKADF